MSDIPNGGTDRNELAAVGASTPAPVEGEIRRRPRHMMEDWAELTAPIRDLIYMGDYGQPCMCSPRGKCLAHANRERAEEALHNLMMHFSKLYDADGYPRDL